MAKPYFLFKMPSGIWYARLQLSDGTQTNNKSTGCRDRASAERVAMGWVVNNNIPSRINSAEENQKKLRPLIKLVEVSQLHFDRDFKNVFQQNLNRKWVKKNANTWSIFLALSNSNKVTEIANDIVYRKCVKTNYEYLQ